MAPMNDLQQIAEATRMLSEARTLDDVRAIRDLAEAARAYAQAAGLGDEAIGYASAIKLDAERKAGAILSEMRESGERATPQTSLQPVTTLADLGVTRVQSSRWQALARLPEDEYSGLRDRVQSRARAESDRAATSIVNTEWDRTVDRMVSPETARLAAIDGLIADILGIAERFDAIAPPPTAVEMGVAASSLRAMLQRMSRRAGKALEVVQ